MSPNSGTEALGKGEPEAKIGQGRPRVHGTLEQWPLQGPLNSSWKREHMSDCKRTELSFSQRMTADDVLGPGTPFSISEQWAPLWLFSFLEELLQREIRENLEPE